MENRRDFFKALVDFTSGVVATKIAQYTPKKEEPKEEVLVPACVTITHEGKEYHPLVVEKTSKDRVGRGIINPDTFNLSELSKYTLRKAKI